MNWINHNLGSLLGLGSLAHSLYLRFGHGRWLSGIQQSVSNLQVQVNSQGLVISEKQNKQA